MSNHKHLGKPEDALATVREEVEAAARDEPGVGSDVESGAVRPPPSGQILDVIDLTPPADGSPPSLIDLTATGRPRKGARPCSLAYII